MHGLTLDDAFDVEEFAPVTIPQKARWIARRDGTSYRQPERLKMIGPNRGGRMVTLIIEYPDQDNYSTIVTGYWSSNGEQAEYHQRKGGVR